MITGGHKMAQTIIKRKSGSDVHDEKNDGSGRERDFIDQKKTSIENEIYSATELDFEDVDFFTGLLSDVCQAEQIESEDNTDILYECVTSHGCFQQENVSNFNSIRVEDMTQDVKPSVIHLKTGFGLQLLSLKEGTISGHRATNKQVPSAVLHRDSIKTHRKKTLAKHLIGNTISEKHQMSDMAKVLFVDLKSLGPLKNHEMLYKPFHCKDCSEAFTNSSDLRKHERSHAGETPFLCKICFKAYAISSKLKRHERSHIGQKTFNCEICSKAFTNSYGMKRHERIHTGDKPYDCKICSKAFTVASSLKRHERVHTGEKPYKCKICFKAFTATSSLKRHERLHTS